MVFIVFEPLFSYSLLQLRTLSLKGAIYWAPDRFFIHRCHVGRAAILLGLLRSLLSSGG